MRLIVPEMVSIALTTSLVAVCTAEICEEISPVAFEVCSASVFTSIATTAKPLPASARAASMVALRARRLVCAAMSVIG
jgi:hypothetical protein